MRLLPLLCLLPVLALAACAHPREVAARTAAATAATPILPEIRAAMIRIALPKVRDWCAGVLVAPDLVATAGHCLLNVDTAEMRFRDEAGAERKGVEIVASGIRYEEVDGERNHFIAGAWDDWALVRVAAAFDGPPLKTRWIMPSALRAAARDGAEIQAAGYSGGTLTAIGGCALAPEEDFGFFEVTCRGGPGDSGGPVVLLTPEGPELIGLVRGGNTEGDRTRAVSAGQFAQWLR